MSGEQVQMLNLADHLSSIFSSYRADYTQREMEYVGMVCKKEIETVLAVEVGRASSGNSSGAGSGSGAGANGTPSKSGGTTSADKDPPHHRHRSDETDIFGRVKKEIVADQKQKWILHVLESNLINTLIQISSQCCKRAEALCDMGHLPDDISTLFLTILTAIVDEYMTPALNVANEFLPPLDSSKQEPDTFYFQPVGLVNLIVDKIQLHYQHFITSRLASNPNTQLITAKRVRECLGRVEVSISGGLARMLSASLKYAQRILSSKQKNSDYKPREDDSDALMSGQPSMACTQLCQFIERQSEAAVAGLEGKNLDMYLQVFGLKLHDVLVHHLHRLLVNTLGAGLLARDVKCYLLCVSRFHLSSVMDKWLELRQAVDLFFVGPSHLKAVVQDSSKLRNMQPTQLMPFIQMRADFSDNKKKILQTLNIRESHMNAPLLPPPPEPTTHHRSAPPL